MIDIVVATRNSAKARELGALLALPGVRWRSIDEFPSVPKIEEDGRTFLANATKKAIVTARHTGCLALADDSGLEVDVLDGAPGIHSARYAGPCGHDFANNAKLLRVLHGRRPEERGAQFRCVLVLADAHRRLASTDGVFRGRIAGAPVGTGGFGYDPIFYLPALGKTVGQLPPRVKNRMSHRAIAVSRMRARVQRLIAAAGARVRPAAD
jgi:XTP/dITP diphosphohydrolase